MGELSNTETDTNRAGRLRVGAVSYLNTKPLVYGLERWSADIELSLDLPSCLADGLAHGTLDVALIPSIEALRHPEYRIVSNACIACRGPVLSVKLLSRVPLPRIQSLALDEGSRTSVALAQILLRRQFEIAPRLLPLPIGTPVEETTADAVLLIGDRAIDPPRGDFVEFWDLGEQWCKWSNLPFVFAAWFARPGAEVGNVSAALEQARDAGIEHLGEIASREASQVGMPVDACQAYLQDNLHFILGAREKQGLKLFFRHATELGFALEGCGPSQRGMTVS